MYRWILILTFCWTAVNGQISGYSAYGFGIESRSLPVRFIGLGNSGSAVPDSIGLNSMNPALWNGFLTTSLQGQIGSSLLGEAVGDYQMGRTQFLGFAFKFPIGERVGIALGVRPRTRAYAQQSFVDSVALEEQSIFYSSEYQLSGGISEFFAGGGYRWNQYLRLGIIFRFYFGNYLTKGATDIDINGSVDSYYRKYMRIDGTQVGLGGHWTNASETFRAAAYLDYNLKFRYYRLYDFYYGPDSSTATESVQFPTTLRVGVSYCWRDRLALNADFQYALVPASLFQDFYLFEPTKSHNPVYFGMGLENIPSNKPGTQLRKKLYYRGGMYVGRTAVYRTNSIVESGITLGLGIPFNRGLDRLDFAMILAQRSGFLDDTIGREQVLSFHASITTGELWFRRMRQ